VVANDLPLDPAATTVADAFAAAGYRTGYVGKWHLDGVPRDGFVPPERRGRFDFWAGWNCAHQYVGAPYHRDTAETLTHDWGPAGETDLAVEFLNGEGPSFLVVAYGPPHAPYDEVPERYRERYDPAELTARANVEPVFGDATAAGPGADPRELLADYYAQVTAVDDQVGRLLGALNDRDRETVVAYTSDHGDMLSSQGYAKKELPYAESVGVPLLVRGPDLPAGRTVDAPVGLVDLAPTLLGLAGVDTDLPADGEDRSALLRGEGATGDSGEALLSHLVSNGQARAQGIPAWRGLQTERYTYARFSDGTDWLLTDDEADPYQSRNLAVDADHREKRERLSARLDERLAALGDPFLPGHEQVRHHGQAAAYDRKERALAERFDREPDLIG
jgi:arylsulfatase A-like enzyme